LEGKPDQAAPGAYHAWSEVARTPTWPSEFRIKYIESALLGKCRTGRGVFARRNLKTTIGEMQILEFCEREEELKEKRS
jgi:hypothetical protein